MTIAQKPGTKTVCHLNFMFLSPFAVDAWGLLGKRFEFGQNGLLGRGANDAQARIASDKTEQGWNRLNVVPKT
jgi:hypothetical protein